MPTIEISHRDLNRLAGRAIPLKTLQERDILYAKGEVEDVAGDVLKIDIKDTNRPDLWSAEGIAREIAGRYGNGGLPSYSVMPPSQTITVASGTVQPLAVGALVRNLTIDEAILSQMIQLQEKIALTFGRGRKELSVGAYDLRFLAFPLRYTTLPAKDISFVPLGEKKELSAKEILASSPKGQQYGRLLDSASRYPVWIDGGGSILSMPPIINSSRAGTVTTETRDVFLDCTGADARMIQTALNVMVTALADRGGKIEAMNIRGSQKITTPDLTPRTASVGMESIAAVTGLSLTLSKAVQFLRQARYEATARGKRIRVRYPAYRQDIMHERDIIEDLLISAGYHQISPLPLALATTGLSDPHEQATERVARAMVGLGLQEVLSYTLTSADTLFRKMEIPPRLVCEIANPMSASWSIFRTWLLPGLLEFLSKNKHIPFPQRVFEIGDCVLPHPSAETRSADVRKLAVAVTDVVAGYEDVASLLDAFLRLAGQDYSLRASSHHSFLPGRMAAIMINKKECGMIGELHPQVLNNWGIEKPVTAFELDLRPFFNVHAR